MKTMREYAYEYEMKHKNKGMVTKLEDYRFLFAEKADKNGKSNSSYAKQFSSIKNRTYKLLSLLIK